MMQIEQVYFMRQGAAVEDAFFDNRDVVTERIAIDTARSDAAARAFAADDQAVNAQLRQMSDQRRAEECTRLGLLDHRLARLGGHELRNLVADPLALFRALRV